MDFFSKLPSLVLTHIFAQLQSEKDIIQLIRASPNALRHYTQYRKIIMRHRLAEILAIDRDGSIVQDAQAIFHFPAVEINSPISTYSIRAISQCLDRRNDRSFPNPSKQRNPTDKDQEDIIRLYRFFSRLIIFVEDYLAKSLDPFPVRAFMSLPIVSSVSPMTHFRGREVDVQPVAFGVINEPERRRLLLQAFVRYELLCKFYHPQVWPHLEGTRYADIIASSHKKLSLKDYEALYCVDEYLKSLHGAVFAQCRESWLPNRQINPKSAIKPTSLSVEDEPPDLASSDDYGLLFPDNVYFDIEQYSSGLISRTVRDMLPCLGLDLLSSILTSLTTDERNRKCFMRWLDAFSCQYSTDYTPWTSMSHFVRRHKYLNVDDMQTWNWKMRMESHNDLLRYGPGCTYSRTPKLDIEEQVRQFHLHNIQLKTFRQRAWIFFYDPSSSLSTSIRPHFPTWTVILAEDESNTDIMDLVHQRERRRSQKWQDYWSGRILDHPFVQREDDNSGPNGYIEDNPCCVPVLRFFERPRRGDTAMCCRCCEP